MQITLTERAAQRVRELMAARGEQFCLRLLVRRSEGALTYHLMLESAPRPTDTVVLAGGLRILVDPTSGELAEGCAIDFLTSLSGFAIYNPHLRTGV